MASKLLLKLRVFDERPAFLYENTSILNKIDFKFTFEILIKP